MPTPIWLISFTEKEYENNIEKRVLKDEGIKERKGRETSPKVSRDFLSILISNP